jgi:predicted permease
MSWLSRLLNVFRSSRVARELDEEMRFHIEERARALAETGLPRDEALRQAARRFGSALRRREESLDVKLLPWLDSILRDVRFGLRTLRRSAVTTAAAVLSLALALGACLAAFSLVDALMLRPLPVRQPDRLVYLTMDADGPDRPEGETFNDPLFVRLRESGRGRVDLFAISTQVIRPVRFAPADPDMERWRTQYVSGDALPQLGVSAALGRLIGPGDDDRPGASPVAVLSHAFWVRRFGGDPSVLGRWFTMEDRPFQVIGVARDGFTGVEPGRPTDVWFPYATYNPRAFGNGDFNWFRVFGRLRDGIEATAAEPVLQAAFSAYRRDRVSGMPGRPAEQIARYLRTSLHLRPAATGPSPLRRQFEQPLLVLAAVAALVLLIAGTNVANLLLARAAAREREMALRLSIGASRGRLVQQMLVESALISCAATVAGLLFAAAAAPSVVTLLASPDDPVQLELGLNGSVALAACVLATMAAALFGLAPALRASGVTPLTALKSGGARSGRRSRAARPLVVAQVAFCLAVLFVGSLLIASFGRLTSVDPGFATSDVLLVSLDQVRPMDAAARRQAIFQLVDRVREIRGVATASAAAFNLIGRAWTHNVRLPGGSAERIEATMEPVSPGFFETMEIPVVEGRPLLDADMAAPSRTVVVNQTFARQYFGDRPAVGRMLAARFGADTDADQHEIVGVAADTRHDVRLPAEPTIFIPLPDRMGATITVRVAGDSPAFSERLRAVVAASSSFRVASVTPQSDVVARTLLRERLLALLAGFFALVGLVLAGIGLYGVLSDAVLQRTPEIGIRIALGARHLRIVRMIVGEAAGTVLAGAVAGLAGGVYLSRYVKALLFEISPLDPGSLAVPLIALAAVAATAVIRPARRAARIDPVVALRAD